MLLSNLLLWEYVLPVNLDTDVPAKANAVVNTSAAIIIKLVSSFFLITKFPPKFMSNSSKRISSFLPLPGLCMPPFPQVSLADLL